MDPQPWLCSHHNLHEVVRLHAMEMADFDFRVDSKSSFCKFLRMAPSDYMVFMLKVLLLKIVNCTGLSGAAAVTRFGYY